MAIPKYDKLLRPILALADSEDTSRRTASQKMISRFALTDEEASRPIPSGGSTYIHNRTGWAMTFLTKGGLIEKVKRGTYRATDLGREFLAKHPAEITLADLKGIEGWEEAWRKEKPDVTQGTTDTPEELVEQAIQQINDTLKSELQDYLAKVDPYRFEQIVVDLLTGMGYGGSREEAAKVTKKSSDEGIDGVINEDRLGLDVIYVQAKRWQNSVGRKEIQSFVGALAGKQASKGVFITTSDFANTAKDYANAVSQKVILIDGQRLAELMIEYNIGISTHRTIAIKRIDSDYFDE